VDDVVRKTGQELLGQPKVESLRDIYRAALLRLRIRNDDDGHPCWCLPMGPLEENHRHDYRCKIARNLTKS
jgi:hypothetical protein